MALDLSSQDVPALKIILLFLSTHFLCLYVLHKLLIILTPTLSSDVAASNRGVSTHFCQVSEGNFLCTTWRIDWATSNDVQVCVCNANMIMVCGFVDKLRLFI